MVIDITRKFFSEIFTGARERTEETSIANWLEKYVGARMEAPNIEVVPTGRDHLLIKWGDGWVIDKQLIMIENPTKKEDHNVGICAQLGPWQPTISTTQYRAHIADETLAVQFKLRWT
jgi:hypothetical protein